jgi:dihydrofolate reductase
MRKIINSTYISLDGVIQDPHLWPSGRHEDDGQGLQIQSELLQGSDALLLGRKTYEGFAAVWPTRTGDPYSDHINSMRKYAVSSTLRDPQWANTTVIAGDPVAEIARLKEEPGENIVQFGFGQLSFALMEHGLLDELRLWVHPFFVGHGGPGDLLYRDAPLATFDLADTTPLASGIVVLTYRRP